jgi:hypothetical protein
VSEFEEKEAPLHHQGMKATTASQTQARRDEEEFCAVDHEARGSDRVALVSFQWDNKWIQKNRLNLKWDRIRKIVITLYRENSRPNGPPSRYPVAVVSSAHRMKTPYCGNSSGKTFPASPPS